MQKKIIQDVVPNTSRSIRNIPVTRTHSTSRTRPHVHAETHVHEEKDEEIVEEEVPTLKTIREVRDEFHSYETKPRSYTKLIIGGVVGIALFAGLFIANSLHKAVIEVTPLTADQKIDFNINLKKNAPASELAFDVVSVQKEGSSVVKSTGKQQVDKKATGTIVVYNNFSTTAQRLIKNTRFETPTGLIFRINESITVPGKKGTVPGSVEVAVFADDVGEKYNVGLTDFTIPGFKTSPKQYAGFFARSKTPLAGGFSGIMKIVSDADKASAEEAIRKQLLADILVDAQTKVPEGYILFPELYTINYTTLNQENLENDQVRIKQNGTFSGVIIKKDDLARYLAGVTVKDYKGEAISIKNIAELSALPTNNNFKLTSDSITIKLAGDAHFVWAVDGEALKQALLGKKRADFFLVQKSFPTLKKGSVSMYPFWKSSFPTNLSKIKIESTE
jgi:hypothetical protein